METVYAIGETIYDIIFSRDQPVAARAGGAMLNSAVSLGRCGIKVEMISELGTDGIGEIVMDFLRENGVSVSFIKPVKGFKTPISLAFLDSRGKARYDFYKSFLPQRLNISWPEVHRGDVVLFGSFYSLDPDIHDKIAGFIRVARDSGALTVYDPNIRKNHLGQIRQLMHFIAENIELADIVRGSDEDFENLFGLKDGLEIYNRLSRSGCKAVIFTRGDQGAELYSGKMFLQVPAKKIRVVSTIGAGDSFNAGIIFGLLKNGLTGADISEIKESKWEEIMAYGTDFAAEVCGSYENYIRQNNQISKG